MEYSLYWLPDTSSKMHQYGHDWLYQAGYFNKVIHHIKKDLSFYDFQPALSPLKKYGFHCELFPPFQLKSTISEKDIFQICQEIAESVSTFDIQLKLNIHQNYLLLSSVYKSHNFYQIQKIIAKKLNHLILLKPQMHHSFDRQFEIPLSNKCEDDCFQDLKKVAHLYWKQALNRPIEIKKFYLCYRETKHNPFKILMKFPLSIHLTD